MTEFSLQAVFLPGGQADLETLFRNVVVLSGDQLALYQKPLSGPL